MADTLRLTVRCGYPNTSLEPTEVSFGLGLSSWSVLKTEHEGAPAYPVSRASVLNAALEGRYAIERELGEGGMATV